MEETKPKSSEIVYGGLVNHREIVYRGNYLRNGPGG